MAPTYTRDNLPSAAKWLLDKMVYDEDGTGTFFCSVGKLWYGLKTWAHNNQGEKVTFTTGQKASSWRIRFAEGSLTVTAGRTQMSATFYPASCLTDTA